MGDAAELAATAVWLASPAAGYVTEQTIVVDGGLTIEPARRRCGPDRPEEESGNQNQLAGQGRALASFPTFKLTPWSNSTPRPGSRRHR
jgi:hypothetical protein